MSYDYKVTIDQTSNKIKKVPLQIITSDMLLNEEIENEGRNEFEEIISFFEETPNKIEYLKTKSGTGDIIKEAYAKFIVAPSKALGIKIEKKTKKNERLEELLKKYEEAKSKMNEESEQEKYYKMEEKNDEESDSDDDRNDFDYENL